MGAESNSRTKSLKLGGRRGHKDSPRVQLKQRLEALTNLVLFPMALALSVPAVLITSFKRKFIMPWKDPALPSRPSQTLKSMQALVEELRKIPFNPKYGWSSLDLQLQFLADLIPILADLDPERAGRFYPYPRPFRPIVFRSSDGTRLAGYLAVHRNRAQRPGLIVLHGGLGSCKHHLYSFQALRAFNWGFNVLAFDSRGFGGTARLSKAPPTLGWKEGEDLISAARLLKTQGGTGKIGGIGYSLGGSAFLNAAAHPEAARLLSGGILSWSGFVDSTAMIKHIHRNPGLLHPYFPIYNVFRLAFSRRTSLYKDLEGLEGIGDFFEQVVPSFYHVTFQELRDRSSAANHMAHIQVPCLSVHSTDDYIVPVWQAYRMRQIARNNPLIKVLILPRGSHCAFAHVDPLWEETITGRFFEYWNDINILATATK